MPIDINKLIDGQDDKKEKFKLPKFKLPKFILPKLPQIKLTNNLTIVIAVLIVALAYIYVEQNKLNYKEKLRQENITEQKEQQEALDNCLDSAELNYDSNWNYECKSRGLKNNCSLPIQNAKIIDKWRTDAKKECMDKYKNGAFITEQSNFNLLDGYKPEKD